MLRSSDTITETVAIQPTPLSVAVCIGTYNQSQYLKGCLDSVFRQTYPIAEIWVSDDCSSDDTATLMSEICRAHPLIRYHRHADNLGPTKNLSWVLSQPATNLIVRLDSDDMMEPDYVSVLAGLMLKYPDAGFAHCAVNQIDASGNLARVRRLARTSEFESPSDALVRNASGFRVAANCILYRSEALRAADYYHPNVGWTSCEDWDLCLRLAINGWGNAYSPQVLTNYRFWSDAVRANRKMGEVATMISVYSNTLEPEYMRRGWSTATLHRYRRRKAALFAEALDSPLFSELDRLRYVSLLRELGNSYSLLISISLFRLRLTPLVRMARSITLVMRDLLKSFMLRARRDA